MGESAGGFFQRRFGIGPVMIKNVHVIQSHPAQRLVERRQHIFPRAPVAIRPGPHVVTGLCGNNQLIPIRREVKLQQTAKRLLRRTVGRAVIISQVEMGDAQVKRAARDGPAVFKRIGAAKVVPQSERKQRQIESGFSAAAVERGVVVASWSGRIHVIGCSR